MPKYKSEMYKGYRVEFVYQYGYIYARAPKLSTGSQYIGAGKTKEKAFNDAKKEINSRIKR